MQLYKGPIKVYINGFNVSEGSTVVVDKDKNKTAGLEIAESSILCEHQAYKTYIKSIAFYIHNDDWVQVPCGHFTDKGDIDMTQLESGMSFLKVKSSVTMKGKPRQVRSAICGNRREITHTWLETLAGADNPNS